MVQTFPLGRCAVLLRIALLCLSVTLTGCVSGTDNAAFQQSRTTAVAATGDYRLGPGDKVKLTVFREQDLSGEFTVDNSGMLPVPFVGPMNVANLSLRDVESAYGQKLIQAQLIQQPKVSAEVTTFRPIFVLGEVHKPGQYPFVAGMTVQRAVALAEGYTYRARESVAVITRGGKQFTVDVSPETQLMPADEIYIPERYF
jgi:polysaccharide biosynthesis/export protein